ncbi:glycosyltransferase family 2 protein [Paenibacillus chitinolyticus]|uniref:glycosyltransferase family 2 protein n=1 Tax=Paenibacillus chitinolyticus TaxID=79263 RepID=UPI002DB5B2E8|nr:glycosyltransferase family 2 protein [Paenibacillus chitinolyticus]MEC0248494.1 glycosyltransferase family 2 protein [Paenibacillus chitinolyticus]
MNTSMNLVIPMAGAGRRFLETGCSRPKMLLDVQGKPMLYWALDSLREHVCLDGTVFVCLEEHLNVWDLEKKIRDYGIRPRIVAVPSVTRGQAETVLLAQGALNPSAPLLIYNCDTYMTSSLGRTLRSLDDGIDGLISVFPSSNPAYSYVELDSAGFVVRVKEKEVISDLASTGLYYFSAAASFVQAAEDAIAGGVSDGGEYYVAPLYNLLLAGGARIVTDLARTCHPLGTPEELREFISLHSAPGSS